MTYRYRSGIEKSVLAILASTIAVLVVLLFVTFSGFFIYQPQALQIEVNRIVPITSYLEVDGKNFPLPEGLQVVEGGYKIENLTIKPSDYALGQGLHTINIIDLLTKEKFFSIEIEITGNLISVKSLK
jgi:hypothetical protein